MVEHAVIRLATIEDLQAVIDLLLLLREETFWAEAVASPDRAHMENWLLMQGLTNPHFSIFVAEDELQGELVGLCGGRLIEHGLAPGVLFLSEWAWYVLPSQRDNGTATALWRRVKAWAMQHGAVGTVNGRWHYWGRTYHGEF
jgi:hypothetical protein